MNSGRTELAVANSPNAERSPARLRRRTACEGERLLLGDFPRRALQDRADQTALQSSLLRFQADRELGRARTPLPVPSRETRFERRA